MSTAKLICVILVTFFAYSCNPNAGKEMVTETVKLNAVLSNTTETILLGDTLRISLRLPDTVTSNLRTQAVQTLQRGFFSMRSFKVDTINRRGVSLAPPIYWTSIGAIEGNLNFVLKNSAKPFEVTINYKPVTKGLYYFEIIPQPGILKMNGNNNANLLVNFSVADKHLMLISNYFGGQSWLDAANQQITEGYGIYAFRVN